MRGGLPLVLGTGIRGGSIHGTAAKRLVIDLPRSSGVQLHPTSLPAGRLGREAYAWVDWLADAGQTWWQMLPLGPPDRHARPTRRRRRSPPGRGCWRSRAPGVARPRSSTSASARRYWIEDWARVRAARRDRRPGALRPRVGRAAGVRRRARRADHRRRPDLRRAGQRRPHAPTRSSSSAGARRRHAARRLHRQGPAVGQPAVRLARDAAPRLPLVGRPAAAHVRALRPRAHRPLPRLRLLLVGPGARRSTR